MVTYHEPQTKYSRNIIRARSETVFDFMLIEFDFLFAIAGSKPIYSANLRFYSVLPILKSAFLFY